MRTITVKGVGSASTRPDHAEITLSIEGRDNNYEKALEIASTAVETMTEALAKAGFDKKALKTTDYSVNTDYRSVRDENGDYTREFNGYICQYSLRLGVDPDSETLGRALGALTSTEPKPELSIRFTLKDPSAVKAELLRLAAQNAREKAEILCAASGVKLGELISVSYDWADINVVSECRVGVMMAEIAPIEPEDIHSSDSAQFVWEIV